MAADRSAATASGRPYQSKVNVVAGGAENAELTLTGVKLGRDLIDAVVFVPKAAEPIPADVTAKTSVFKDGVIKIAENTTGGRLLVYWRHAR
jgi:hypothetical protein